MDNREEEQMDNREQNPPIGRTNDLLKVLNMGRLQAIEQFTLLNLADWLDSGISWQEFMHFLQTIPPSVRKLSLLNFWPTPPEPIPPFNLLAEELMANLTKEVDFGTDGFLQALEEPVLGRIANEILKAVSTVGEESKLRVLSIPGFESDADLRDSLAAARKILTVNMLGLTEDSDDSEDEDADEVAGEDAGGDEDGEQQPTLSP